ncbi:hypothetical protein OAT11_08205 [Nitrospinaceae bacterium]|nr:hypothetical protein [Nitrospinaceae bacterium]
MKITIYLLIALMLMGIEGCPSDPLTSNEVCSGEPPLFKLYVVSDTDEPFDIAIQSVGIAVHKTNKTATLFNPTTGVGPTYVHKTRVSKKGDIINIPFKPTDIHKNKGCITDYSVSVDVSSKYRYTSDAPDGWWSKGDLINGINGTETKRSSVELKCHAPSGQQIKRCFFQVTIGEEAKEQKKYFGLKGEIGLSSYTYKRAIVAPLSGGIGGTSIFNTFANE